MASYFFCFAKKSNQKKATPTVPVALRATALRCSTERAAAELAQPAWRPASLRHPRRTTPVPPALLGGTNGASPQAPSGVPFLLVDPPSNVWGRDLFGAPVGPAEKRRRDGGSPSRMSERTQPPGCVSEFRGDPSRRASQGSRTQCDRDLRGRLLLVTFLGEARKVTRRQAKKRPIQRHWIPAFAGMTLN